MESVAGLAALMLFVLWLGYLVPHRVRHRQQLLESRTEDRFSGSLRVLAVAGPAVGGAVQSNTVDSASPGTPDDLTSGAHRSLLGSVSADGGGSGTPDAPSIPPQHQLPRKEEGTLAVETTANTDRRHAASPRRGDDTSPRPDVSTSVGRGPTGGPTRLQVLEQRAAAARRRLSLTVLLLLATAVAWVCVGFGIVAWPVGAGPTTLLLLVLVLGRRAVVAAKRADAAWLAQRRAAREGAGREGAQTAAAGVAGAAGRTGTAGAGASGAAGAPGRRRPATGAPVAVRNTPPRVTGHAVHASQLATQMIPRVTPLARDSGAATGVAGRATGVGRGASGSDADADSRAGRGDGRAGDRADGDSERGPGASAGGDSGERVAPSALPREEAAASDRAAASDGDRAPTGSAWDPVPVPRPTYTLKASAPRREPAPFTGASPAAEAASWRAPVRASDAEGLGSSGANASLAEAPLVQGDAPGSGAPASGKEVESAPPVAPARAPGDEPKPKTETLGLDLNEILARRRAAGQ